MILSSCYLKKRFSRFQLSPKCSPYSIDLLMMDKSVVKFVVFDDIIFISVIISTIFKICIDMY